MRLNKLLSILAALFLISILPGCVTIKQGEVGVKRKFGKFYEYVKFW